MKEHNILLMVEKIILQETGIIINKERFIDLEIALHSRLVFHKMLPQQYVQFLKNNNNEIIFLASLFTIQETCFYRYKAHFDRLKLEIIPELLVKNAKTHSLRILSAGCATGEEPYTIAMILIDTIPDIKDWDIKILATDINENALTIAKEALYSKYKLRNIDDWYVNRYFDTELTPNNIIYYRMHERVKKLVSFKQYNLIREPFDLTPTDSLDIIFCENVMIYFCHSSVQRLINNFYSILKQAGVLYLGYSETLNLVSHNFELTWWNDSFAYRKIDTENTVLPIQPLLEQEPVELFNYNKSYEELIELIKNNFEEGMASNVAHLLKKLEKGNFKLTENFYILKAEYCFDAKDYMNAADACRKAINTNPYFIDAHILLSVIYLQFDMLDSAAFELQTCLYIDSASILAHYFFSIFYKKIENTERHHFHLANACQFYKEKKGIFETSFYPVNPTTNRNINENLS